MPTYAAFLRGIGPMNPSMQNANLRRVAEELGHGNVRTVISSGNVVFDTDSTDPGGMEAAMEAAWLDRLGFRSTTVIRSQQHLRDLVSGDPFDGRQHGRTTYLLVTLLKEPPPTSWTPPPATGDGATRIVGHTDREVFSVTDTTAANTPDFMTYLEHQLGTAITSRTWLTIQRVLARM